mmetsp:Transcript_174321/g.424074  ORF Transcript_174321/g.424074 Transcript_174321/m.424074 type:complete len:263 (-) Transcript_174321:2536-3324(-)
MAAKAIMAMICSDSVTGENHHGQPVRCTLYNMARWEPPRKTIAAWTTLRHSRRRDYSPDIPGAGALSSAPPDNAYMLGELVHFLAQIVVGLRGLLLLGLWAQLPERNVSLLHGVLQAHEKQLRQLPPLKGLNVQVGKVLGPAVQPITVHHASHLLLQHVHLAGLRHALLILVLLPSQIHAVLLCALELVCNYRGCRRGLPVLLKDDVPEKPDVEAEQPDRDDTCLEGLLNPSFGADAVPSQHRELVDGPAGIPVHGLLQDGC